MARGGISGLAVALAAAGGYLMYAGIRDVPLLEGLRELAGGKLPAGKPRQVSSATIRARIDTPATAADTGQYKLGPVRPHVKAAAYEVGPKFGIKTIGGWRAGDRYDHPLGLALDFMTHSGQALADYLVANHVRLRITYVIWNRQVWNVARIKDGWHAYHGISDHTDHVHASFEA